MIRLVDGQDLDTNNVQYATLSHCWGPGGVPIKLSSSNIHYYRRQVPWHLLPLTFQEAILAAIRLGINYMWIDALCIMQDSAADWNVEASKMMQVYTNGYLNISADASADGSGGLFRQRDPAMLQSFLIPSDCAGNNIPYYCHVRNWDRYVENAPLKMRSWVTQERFMSPRVAHFSNDQVHWECGELMTSESVDASFHLTRYTTRTPVKSLGSLYLGLDDPEKLEQFYRLWYDLVESYSAGNLTRISDRPVAIAGLARTFSHLLKLESKDYCCGLWRPYLVLEMMWYTFRSTDRPNYSVPSWSWLSVNGDAWFKTRSTVIVYKAVTEVLNVCITASDDPFGAVLSGYLEVRAPICRATIRRAPEPFPWMDRSGRKCEHSIILGQDELKEGTSYFLQLDECSPEFLDKVLSPGIFLLLGQGGVGRGTNVYPRSQLGSYEVGHYECLVLTPVPSKGLFRRAGYVSFAGVTSPIGRDDGHDFCSILDMHFQASEIPRHLYRDVDGRFMYTVILA
ncbi:HET-domain-containing protein [Apiospora sp. TS-2023a]